MSSLIYNPEFIISFLLSLVGIILSFYFYLKERKFRQISYTYQTTSVSFNNTPFDKISFSYDGRSMDSFSITDLIIWCNGKEMINRDDIAPISPLTVYSSSEILEYQLIFSNEPCNNFHITKINENTLSFDFDYMCKNNGVAVRIVHAGACSTLSVNCKIKDGKKTLFVNPRKGFIYPLISSQFVKNILSRKVTSFIFILFTIFLFPNAFIQSANYANNNYFGFPSDSIFMNLDSVVIFVLCIFSFFLSIPHIYNLFKNEPPDDLINCTFCER